MKTEIELMELRNKLGRTLEIIDKNDISGFGLNIQFKSNTEEGFTDDDKALVEEVLGSDPKLTKDISRGISNMLTSILISRIESINNTIMNNIIHTSPISEL